MGVAIANMTEIRHCDGTTDVRLRLHLQNAGWDITSGPAAGADWDAAYPGAAVSVTAAESAVAATWPSWWASLSSSQRAAVGERIHQMAGELAAAFAP